MIRYKQADSERELKQILALQKQNLPVNLPREDQQTQGFLTVKHSLYLLRSMNLAFPHTLAVHQQQVVGYALAMHPKFRARIALLRPMFAEIDKTLEDSSSYMVMGQICIAKLYRGKGVFRGLYEAMQQFVAPDYNQIITEVDARNTRSLNAHKAIGFRELTRYQHGKREWALIMLE